MNSSEPLTMKLRSGTKYISPCFTPTRRRQPHNNENTKEMTPRQLFTPLNLKSTDTIQRFHEIGVQDTNPEVELQRLTISQLKETIAGISMESESQRALINSLQERMIEFDARERYYMEEIAMLKKTLQDTRNTLESTCKETSVLKERNNTLWNIVKEMKHEIQELKGNIRVFCRIRPPLKTETPISSMEIIHRLKGTATLEIKTAETVKAKGKTHAFTFDHVYGKNDTQSDVYSEISGLVEGCVNGQSVSIFAYGQTGSGKSFTIQGDPPKNPGVIHRAVDQIFDDPAISSDWTMEVSIYEIYNENIRDLLHSDEKGKYTYTIHHSTDGTSRINNLKTVSVQTATEVFDLIEASYKLRCTASTKQNAGSSRSHYIFTLKIHGKRDEKEFHGVLNVIDLAGSEKYDTEQTKCRQTETKHINTSLSAIGDVIRAMGSGEKHIPYRNSKLTHVLQNCLSGPNAKVLMFVTIPSNVESVSETLNTLLFASKVNACKVK